MVVVAAGVTMTVVEAETEPPREVTHESVKAVVVASASVRMNPSDEPEDICAPALSFMEHPMVPTLAHTRRTELPAVVRDGSAMSEAMACMLGVVGVVVVAGVVDVVWPVPCCC